MAVFHVFYTIRIWLMNLINNVLMAIILLVMAIEKSLEINAKEELILNRNEFLAFFQISFLEYLNFSFIC
jgi:hypothetical protein